MSTLRKLGSSTTRDSSADRSPLLSTINGLKKRFGLLIQSQEVLPRSAAEEEVVPIHLT